MAVTEPTTGTDTTKIKTTAVKKDGRYVVNGQKVWISRVQHSDLMILLARTTPLAQVEEEVRGHVYLHRRLRESIGKGLTVKPIANLVNHETNELFFDNLEIPEENLIGDEGRGFKYILDGLNAERTLMPPSASATVTGSSSGHASTRTSESCSTVRSARTRAYSSRSPTLSSRLRPQT
jgi:acyl-CoA dehydrogenase